MLKDERVKKEITQLDLAASLSKPQSFVAKYEGGERGLDVIELLAILAALEVGAPGFIRRLEAALAK